MPPRRLDVVGELPTSLQPGPGRGPQLGEGTLQGRLLLACRYEPGTVSELAARLDESVTVVLAAVLVLESEGELSRRGRRGGEVVFACARALSAVDAEAERVLERVRL